MSGMQFDLFPTEAVLRRVDPAANAYRYHRLEVRPTLLGDWVLVREAGRIGQEGRVREDVFAGPGEALDALHAFVRVKVRRGYWTG